MTNKPKRTGPPYADGKGPKIQVSYKLAADVVEFLRAQDRPQSQVIEDAVRISGGMKRKVSREIAILEWQVMPKSDRETARYSSSGMWIGAGERFDPLEYCEHFGITSGMESSGIKHVQSLTKSIDNDQLIFVSHFMAMPEKENDDES